MRLPRTPLIATLLALVLAHPADAALGDRKTLVVRGRTIDQEGFPVEKVRVWVEGARRVSTFSDPDGQFTLTIPIGTPEDLRRATLRLAVRAERKGWRFTVPGGDTRLGLELALETAEGGMGRCVARSNDARFAASAARAVALDGEAVGLASVNFLGVKGELTGEEAWPALGNVAQSALSFPVASPSAAPRAKSAPEPVRPAPASPPTAPATPMASPPAPTLAPPRPVEAERTPKRKPRPKTEEAEIAKRSRRDSEAERALAELRARAARDSLAMVRRLAEQDAKRIARTRQQAERILARSAGRAEKVAAPSLDPRPVSRITSPLPGPGDTVQVTAVTPPPPPAIEREPVAERPAARDSALDRWRDARWQRQGVDPGPPPSEPARDSRKRSPMPERRSSPRARKPVVVADSLVVERPAAPERPMPAGSATPPSAARPSPTPSPTPAPALAPSGPSIFPEPPLHVSRTRAAPLVIRSGSGARGAADSCECRIEGTVEVESEAPLRNRERIEISLQWYPQLRDTVELFMGSPRPFRLPIAPCGPQRLHLRVLSSGHFAVISREAMAGFRCEGGRVFQPRVVLAPR